MNTAKRGNITNTAKKIIHITPEELEIIIEDIEKISRKIETKEITERELKNCIYTYSYLKTANGRSISMQNKINDLAKFIDQQETLLERMKKENRVIDNSDFPALEKNIKEIRIKSASEEMSAEELRDVIDEYSYLQKARSITPYVESKIKYWATFIYFLEKKLENLKRDDLIITNNKLKNIKRDIASINQQIEIYGSSPEYLKNFIDQFSFLKVAIGNTPNVHKKLKELKELIYQREEQLKKIQKDKTIITKEQLDDISKNIIKSYLELSENRFAAKDLKDFIDKYSHLKEKTSSDPYIKETLANFQKIIIQQEEKLKTMRPDELILAPQATPMLATQNIPELTRKQLGVTAKNMHTLYKQIEKNGFNIEELKKFIAEYSYLKETTSSNPTLQKIIQRLKENLVYSEVQWELRIEYKEINDFLDKYSSLAIHSYRDHSKQKARDQLKISIARYKERLKIIEYTNIPEINKQRYDAKIIKDFLDKYSHLTVFDPSGEFQKIITKREEQLKRIEQNIDKQTETILKNISQDSLKTTESDKKSEDCIADDIKKDTSNNPEPQKNRELPKTIAYQTTQLKSRITRELEGRSIRYCSSTPHHAKKSRQQIEKDLPKPCDMHSTTSHLHKDGSIQTPDYEHSIKQSKDQETPISKYI